jgi:hypothetical protein
MNCDSNGMILDVSIWCLVLVAFIIQLGFCIQGGRRLFRLVLSIPIAVACTGITVFLFYFFGEGLVVPYEVTTGTETITFMVTKGISLFGFNIYDPHIVHFGIQLSCVTLMNFIVLSRFFRQNPK